MDQSVVHDVHMAINLVHRLVYFVPEAGEEYSALGVQGAGGYFGSRSAPMGPVSDEVIIATFYNFSPVAVTSAMPGVWEAASPESLQAARFRVVQRALERVGAGLSPDEIAEARSLIDPVVAGLGHGGKPLAAANASVSLPDDPLIALWQQLTVVREWRGDVVFLHEVVPGIAESSYGIHVAELAGLPQAVQQHLFEEAVKPYGEPMRQQLAVFLILPYFAVR
jgi:hypothetical protein